MKLKEFAELFDCTRIWIRTLGIPTGIALEQKEPENEYDEEGFDVDQFLFEHPDIANLEGEIKSGGWWQWNCEGDAEYCGNSVIGLGAGYAEFTCQCCGENIYEQPAPNVRYPDHPAEWACKKCARVICAPCAHDGGLCCQCSKIDQSDPTYHNVFLEGC